jgi:hypothetical protein
MTIDTAERIDPTVAAEDVGNIVALEHVNLTVPDQTVATWFYIVGLGFTRDPYMMVSPENMWANAGEQEFHLPTRGPQVLPGHIGVVVPSLDALQQRLRSIEPHLKGTQFAWSAKKGLVTATCPWGNEFRCYGPSEEFGDMTLGVPYVELLVKPGTADGIARFYQQVMGSPAKVSRSKKGSVTSVSVGRAQEIRFRESPEAPADYAGHHIAVYVANISASYGFFEEKGIIMEAMRNHQYRFKEIVDPETGEPLAQLEHEVRSLQHPMFARPFVNRNPAQMLGGYRRGQDAFTPAGA